MKYAYSEISVLNLRHRTTPHECKITFVRRIVVPPHALWLDVRKPYCEAFEQTRPNDKYLRLISKHFSFDHRYPWSHYKY